MMKRSSSEIRYGAKRYRILERMAYRGRTLLVVGRLRTGDRPVLQVVERGVTDQMRCLQVLPYSRQTLGRLRLLDEVAKPHANLPILVDSLRRGQQVLVLTRWIDGPALSEYLQSCRSGREPWPSVLVVVNLVRRLAQACQLLHHRLGVVHGDIHPGNLVLCRHAKQLVPIDFGSAWYVETARRRSPGDGAHRCYAAPECSSTDRTPDFRSDQFSTMVVCYEMLTGRVPYDGLGGCAGLVEGQQQQQLSWVAPSGILKHQGYLPSNMARMLDRVVSQALALDANHRYASDREWLNALGELASLLHGKPELSGPNRWLLRQIERVSGLLRRK